MADFKRKPRFWYEYGGERHMVPEHFVYKMHDTKGGGSDIGEAFFTWAFNKHSISIVDIKILYSSEDRSKTTKDQAVASNTFFVAMVRGKDKRGVEKVGDGEVGSESINNYQRGYPAGMAIKRAKVNMGKEFFNLVDLKYAMDCRDAVVEFGQDKGKTLETIAQAGNGINTIRWFASDKFNGDDMFKMKAQEFLAVYIDKTSVEGAPLANPHIQSQVQPNAAQPVQHSAASTVTSHHSQGHQGASHQVNQQAVMPNVQPSQVVPNVPAPISREHLDVLKAYRTRFFLTDQQITAIAHELFGQGFTWKTATFDQGVRFLARLEQQFGKI